MRQLKLQTEKMQAYVEDGIGWITFNQPERRNAVSFAMWQAIPEIIDDFAKSDDVRVVVMHLPSFLFFSTLLDDRESRAI